MNNYQFEICANSVESCLAAQTGGANRVELCAGIPEGGTTPSYGEIKTARRILTTTRLHVIIRPRGGDFLYTPLELERMTEDIAVARQLGADGVVFGCLTPDGDVDTNSCKLLMEAAQGMSVTFHRAFDNCRDPFRALEDIIALGCDRILTSGQRRADGRLTILAGCGVNEENIAEIATQTGVHEFHFSAREVQPSLMKYRNPDVYMGDADADETTIMRTTERRVRATIEALKTEGM